MALATSCQLRSAQSFESKSLVVAATTKPAITLRTLASQAFWRARALALAKDGEPRCGGSAERVEDELCLGHGDASAGWARRQLTTGMPDVGREVRPQTSGAANRGGRPGLQAGCDAMIRLSAASSCSQVRPG